MTGDPGHRLWGGRFTGEPGEELRALGDSLRFDIRLIAVDIRGSIAHATMLGERDIIPRGDAKRIVKGLRGLLRDFERGALPIDGATDEDVHSFVERLLTERIGPAGGRLHTARSRNDQVATDLRLWLRDEMEAARGELRNLVGELVAAADGVTDLLLPAYTHLQRGQPTTLAHHLLAHAEPLVRDDGRIRDLLARADECPLGSGAATGTPFPVDRRAVARALGFARPSPNSMDAVADRDFAVETAAAAALGMTHLSRLAEDVVLWTSSEFGFAACDDTVSTGSSIMPQKRNPDVAELVRGKTGRVTGDLVALLTMLKGLPLTYNRDLQEDKEALFDAVDTWRLALRASAALIRGLTFDRDACARALGRGFPEATEVADHLVERGVPFRTAHEVAGRAVRLAEERGLATLRYLDDADWPALHPDLDATVVPRLDPATAVRRRSHVGGPAPRAVKQALKRLRRFASG